MLSNKKINVIIVSLIAVAVVFTGIFVANPSLLGITTAAAEVPYLEKLFDKDSVQAINIKMDDTSWQEMLDSAIEEEYFPCDITINGERFCQVGIRPKGNSSLTMVASSDDTDRYSFKIKMDEYVDGQTYYGLSKFVINNMQGDATYMKEYLSYDLYEYMGVEAPAYAFADISINGSEWGLYLAVEAVEQEFASRTFGADYGQLYKPESSDLAGGRGPGGVGQMPPDRNDTSFASGGAMQRPPGDGQMPPCGNDTSFASGGAMQRPSGGGQTPPDMNGQPSDQQFQQRQASQGAMNMPPGDGQMPQGAPGGADIPGERGGSGSGADLVYTDDEISSYNQIFDEAMFKNNDDTDKQRVIAALKTLSTSTDTTELETAINVDEVLRYFAVNTAIVNLDSYVCSFKHNYYLYEDDGQLSILPWDLNLSFAGFQSGNASDAVNFPIDSPVSSGVDLAERPLIGALLAIDDYKEIYHDYLQQIVDEYFDGGYFEAAVNRVNSLISGYVAKDATAFYTFEQYTAAVATLKQYGALRASSIDGQLRGTIPSTYDAQETSTNALIDASSINISSMGTQGGGRGKVDRGGFT